MRFALVCAVSRRMPKGVAMAVFSAAALVSWRRARELPTAAARPRRRTTTRAAATTRRSTAGVDAAALEQRLAQSEALVRNSQPTVQLGGYVDLGYLRPGGERIRLHRRLRSRLLSAVRPAALPGPRIRLGVPGRHPGARGQHARRGRRPRVGAGRARVTTASTRAARPASSPTR